MFTSKKDFSLLRYGGLLILLSLMLIMTIGVSSVQAQAVDTLGARAAKSYITLSNATSQTPVQIPGFSLLVGDTITTNTDTVFISFTSATPRFLFAASKGPYPVQVTGTVVADSARVYQGSAAYAAGTALFIKISGSVSGTYDTLTIASPFVIGKTSSVLAFSDSTSTDSLRFAVGHSSAAVTNGLHWGNTNVLLPATIYTVATAVAPAAATNAGFTFNGGTYNCTDRWGNIPYDKNTTVSIAPVLDGTSTPGNGTLSGSVTKAATAGTNLTATCTRAWTAEKYTKAENINLTVTANNTVTSGTITIGPGAAANISASVNATYTENITVDQTIQYTIAVTDSNFNPIGSQAFSWSENTPHGGTIGSNTTGSNGLFSPVTFTPNKFFVGADTIKFTAGSAKLLRPITITAGQIGGIIVDYASTASGSGKTEAIGAGQTVYVRAFIRDTYGNPIDATSASQVIFTNIGKNGKNTSLGATALTSSITQPLYPNTVKTAVGVAASYAVSTNFRASSPDSVQAALGTYTGTITIQNRSDVPATVKLVQSVAGDSSLVVSNYANQTTFTDTVWDQYGNLVTAPTATGATVAPVRSAYAMYFSTKGNLAFLRTNDTTALDTLYASSGIINRVVTTTKVAGLDTLKTWSANNSAVAAAAPFWVTPAVFAKVAITPHVDTTAVAGRVDFFQVEKKDTYGNHIDWGLAGGTQKGNSPAANFVVPNLTLISNDSTALVADTVSTGKNRGGKVAKVARIGTAGIASVNGSLNFQVKYTPYNVTADTQKIYALLTFADTVQVRSIPTGPLASFTVTIAAADSSKNAGDSVKVTIKPFDAASTPNQIYSYSGGGEVFTITNSSVPAVTSKDSTWYFTYVNTRGQYVKSTGSAIPDTVFSQGQAILYLHKFASEGSAVNKVTITAISVGSITATSANGSKFAPLASNTAASSFKWTITTPDTVTVGTVFNYTITPRDTYRNANLVTTNFATITSDQGVNFDAGANPKIFAGPTVYTATQKIINGTLTITVSDGSSVIYGQSTAIVVIPAVVNVSVSGTVAYASAAANAIGGATVTLTPATGTALTTTASASGAFTFSGVAAGTYTLAASKTGNWGGVNATDALTVARHSAGISLLSGLALTAGDVNANSAVNNTDALLIMRRSLGIDNSFVAGDWVFGSQAVTVGTSNVTANISGLAVGDVNASYVPASGTAFTKSPASISLKGSSDKLTVSGASAADLGAVTMKINVNSAKVASVSSKLPGFMSRVNDDGAVTFGWYAKDGQAVHFNANEAIVTVTLDKKASDNSNVTISSDLADLTGAAIDNSLAVSTKEIPTAFGLSQNYPNPFNPSTQINYDLPQAGLVTLSVYNMLGQEVGKLVNEQKEAGSYTVTWAPHNLASGVYIYRIHVQTEKDSYTSVKRLTLLK